MLAFAHANVKNPVLHALGDIAVLATVIAILIVAAAVVMGFRPQRVKGGFRLSLLSLVAAALSMKNGGSNAVFLIASVVAFGSALAAASYVVFAERRHLAAA